MNIKYLLFLSAALVKIDNVFATSLESPGLLIESAPSGKYGAGAAAATGTTFDQSLFMDSDNGSAAEVPMGSSSATIAPTPPSNNSKNQEEDPGLLFDVAPTNKYRNKPESSIVDIPSFMDSTGGNAAEVPISPYVIIGVDFDQMGGAPVYNGASNTGSVPFTDNGAYFTIGVDKQISQSWILGGYLKQKGSFGVQAQQNVNGSNSFLPSVSSTEARIQAGYGTSFGLANIIRVDGMTGAYGAPGVEISPALRFEDFLRYDTQYNKEFYQFTGGRARIRTDGGWDSRAFIGQGFQFTDRNTYEVSFIQDYSATGNIVNGGPLTYTGTNNPVGVVSKQYLSNSYTHVFSNKTSLSANANWVGSSYFSGNYQSGYEFEASFRVPF